MINAIRVFLWIELGLFVLLGLVLPLAACIFYFPGEAIYKFISICMLGLPYLFHLETAPFFVWFWLSAGAICVLIKLLIMEDDEEITAGGAALAGFGVIIAFFVLYVVIVFALVALYSLDIDTSSALGALAYSISGFTGF
ncbi:hypothetical protein [Parvibacter caecicola]|uniref:Uncharacterized protein n=2 Tax=Parvibacter caecicola TaxID=747645 RepID=A0A4V5KJS9_9ACTN|nr:hypothetical protein [Parvibacter caecicola]TJW10338.1 hypothetical protein E5982_07270 [Parvibacter caecicola]